MYLDGLFCTRCNKETKYKTGINPDDFQPDVCLCGGKRNVKTITDNADNEITEESNVEME